jgi:hypothetical protein
MLKVVYCCWCSFFFFLLPLFFSDFGPMASVILGKLRQLRLAPTGVEEVWVGNLIRDGGDGYVEIVCRLCEEINLSSYRLGLSFLRSSGYIEPLLSFLANFGAEFLWDLEDVLDSVESRTYLLDFLSSNLQLCRLERMRKRVVEVPSDPLVAVLAQLGAVLRPSELLASDPASQSKRSVVHALMPRVRELVLSTSGARLVTPTSLPAVLAQYNEMSEKMRSYYEMRKQAAAQKLDVTVKCFEWGATAKGQETEFRSICAQAGATGSTKTSFSMYDLLLMDREMLRVVKVSRRSSARAVAREFVLSAGVPDRGGRVGEGRTGKMPGFKPRQELAGAPKKQRNYQPRKAAEKTAEKTPGSNAGGGGGGGGGKKKKAGGKKTKGAWTEEKKRPNMASSTEKNEMKSSPKRPNNGNN